MVRILCIGDSHIPKRATDLPEQMYEKIDELTQNELYDEIFFTGDLINFPELLTFLDLKTKGNLFRVIGNMDYYYGYRDLPTFQKLDIELENRVKIRIGLIHGAQIKPRGDHDQLETLAIERKCNILVSGHTHKEEVFLSGKGVLLINPGSITGAWSFIATGIPSCIELSIKNSIEEINVYLFQLNRKNREINTSKSNFIFKNGLLYRKK
ncbi:MAG: YfcE family phosphodiesterase [Promethearchaeota archaeon]